MEENQPLTLEQTLPEQSSLPEQSPPAEEEENHRIEEMQEEVARLRQEKRARLLLDEARQRLTEKGISPRFALFLVGEDAEQTRRNIAEFERDYSAALQEQIQRRLPHAAPRDFGTERHTPCRLGVRRVDSGDGTR